MRIPFMTVKAYYEDYWSPGGAEYTGSMSADYARTLGAIVRPPDATLDVGCGDGRQSGLWLREHAARYVGVDISARAVEAARLLGLDAHVIEDASVLPFEDEAYDVVVCIEVFEHLFEPQRAAREILRVLRPGGHLVAQVPNVAQWWHRGVLAVKGRFVPYGDAIDEPWRDPHIRFFTFESLARMLTAEGFEVLRSEGETSSLMCDLPVLRRLDRGPGPVSRWLIERRPDIFSKRVRIVGRRPPTPQSRPAVG
jgi:methionine biosynthesis protein MetW